MLRFIARGDRDFFSGFSVESRLTFSFDVTDGDKTVEINVNAQQYPTPALALAYLKTQRFAQFPDYVPASEETSTLNKAVPRAGTADAGVFRHTILPVRDTE